MTKKTKIRLLNVGIFVLFFSLGITFFQEDGSSKNLTYAHLKNKNIKFDSVVCQSESIWSVVLVNQGEKVLVVDRVQSSCDCVEVIYSSKLISPRGSDTLYVRVNTSEPKEVNEQVLIHCNSPQSPLQVRVTGKVVKP